MQIIHLHRWLPARIAQMSRRRLGGILFSVTLLAIALLVLAFALMRTSVHAQQPQSHAVFASYADSSDIDAEDNLPFIQAGRAESPSNSKYDAAGRPVGRAWYTYHEWKGDHLLDATSKRAFHKYKAAHIKQWIATYQSVAKELGAKYDIPPALILSQAAMESMWGQSKLAKCASNFFGHKWSKKWKGKAGVVGFVNAHDDDEDDVFIHYETIWWTFRNHVAILEGYRERYGRNPKSLREWGDCLCKGQMRYATACKKDYAGDLVRMAATLKKFGYRE